MASGNSFPNSTFSYSVGAEIYTGAVLFVDNGNTNAAANAPGTRNKPYSSIENALNSADLTANNGDLIVVMPGHTEECASAGAITCDVAGVTIKGIGHGSDQPQIRFTTAATADINVTANNVTFENIRFTAAFADVTAAIDIGADHIKFLGCRFDEEATNENYVVVMNVADGNDGLHVEGCTYIGNDASNDHFIEMAGTHDNVVIKNNHMAHLTAQAATVAMIESATAQNNIQIIGNTFHSESAAVAAAFVVLTGTANTGVAANNFMSHVDADATAANSVSAFDVTGCGSFNNLIAATGDITGVEFGTAEDLT